MDDFTTTLAKLIIIHAQELECLEVGTEQYESAARSFHEMVSMYYEARKSEEEKDRRSADTLLHALSIVSGFLTTGVNLLWYSHETNKGYKFEQDGIVTSSTFKDLKSKMKPGK